MLDSIDKKDCVCLENLYVENGKFDNHKAVIENGNEESRDRLNNNIYVYFRKE